MRTPLLLAAVALASPSFAQMMRPLDIDESGRVTFQAQAPSANSVEVVGKGDGNGLGTTPIPLAKGANGDWKTTTEPIRPGFHYYDLLIDGVATTDPQNHAYFGWGRWTSGLEIPDPDNDFYSPKVGVPRGETRIVHYDSTTTGRTRKCLVYTPANYDEDPEMEYPVLYLQHGAGESEIAWLAQGKVNFIMDNLIHEGRALPMIVVMDNGYAASAGATNWYMPPYQSNRFEQLVIEELIPLIESRFRVRTSPDGRAIAGLSMGGQQAATIVIQNSNTFSYLGMFSAGLPSTSILTNAVADRLNDEMELIWIGTGLQDEFLDSYILVARNAMVQRGVVHQYEAIDGAHEWQVWRKCLNRFAPKLFRPNLATEQIDVSIRTPEQPGGFSVLDVRPPARPDYRLQYSNDLRIWSDLEIDGAKPDPSAPLALPLVDMAFLRLTEEPWE